ncbi:hypothetical protein DNL40_02345 [Xylanimonas oleitrophica]|uniref:DUF2190 family protein n=1 Tax=Xylanimonas oleitrophica TaxID=2607479 RepID=A0A2W5WVN9_9MICO|nr:DUF2190 family protein [Xylanimonas oleitrophica]PZR55230.1 hypothetical protein DNL40_02345 [Xylanimonas oleitrophica]
MATNEYLRDAVHVTLPVASGVKSGQAVKVGSLVGVAITDRAEDGTATVWRAGAFNLSVTGAVTNVGDPVYITSSGQLTATATDNTLFGYALATKAAAAAEIPVAIAQV